MIDFILTCQFYGFGGAGIAYLAYTAIYNYGYTGNIWGK